MTLADFPQRRPCRIAGFDQPLHRLFSLGLITGATAEILRVAPLGDPLQVKVEGTLISIRRQEARQIRVEPHE